MTGSYQWRTQFANLTDSLSLHTDRRPVELRRGLTVRAIYIINLINVLCTLTVRRSSTGYADELCHVTDPDRLDVDLTGCISVCFTSQAFGDAEEAEEAAKAKPQILTTEVWRSVIIELEVRFNWFNESSI